MAKQEEVETADNLAVLIGNVSGQINALQLQVQQGQEQTTKRIDDLRDSINRSSEALNRRIDDHKAASNERFQALEEDLRGTRNKAYAGSSVIAATMSGFFKLMEYLVKGS